MNCPPLLVFPESVVIPLSLNVLKPSLGLFLPFLSLLDPPIGLLLAFVGLLLRSLSLHLALDGLHFALDLGLFLDGFLDRLRGEGVARLEALVELLFFLNVIDHALLRGLRCLPLRFFPRGRFLLWECWGSLLPLVGRFPFDNLPLRGSFGLRLGFLFQIQVKIVVFLFLLKRFCLLDRRLPLRGLPLVRDWNLPLLLRRSLTLLRRLPHRSTSLRWLPVGSDFLRRWPDWFGNLWGHYLPLWRWYESLGSRSVDFLFPCVLLLLLVNWSLFLILFLHACVIYSIGPLLADGPAVNRGFIVILLPLNWWRRPHGWWGLFLGWEHHSLLNDLFLIDRLGDGFTRHHFFLVTVYPFLSDVHYVPVIAQLSLFRTLAMARVPLCGAAAVFLLRRGPLGLSPLRPLFGLSLSLCLATLHYLVRAMSRGRGLLDNRHLLHSLSRGELRDPVVLLCAHLQLVVLLGR